MNTDKTSTIGILEEFRIEFQDFWQRLPNKGFFLALLAAWLALFQFAGNSTLGYIPTPSLLGWMYDAYAPGVDASLFDDSHGKLVPFLVLGLFWWKRKELLDQPLRTWWPALSLVVLGLFIHLAGYAVQQPRISIVGLFTGIYGLMGLAWGPRWLARSFFPFFLFIFCVPFGSLAENITFRLRLLVCQLVELISNDFFMIDVKRIGTSLSNATYGYQYEVAAACSGMRSLLTIFVIATVFGFVSFRSVWQRVVVMVAAAPLAVLGNVVRMLLIIIAAEIGGQDWGSWVHDNSAFSLVPYVPAFLGLFGLGYLLERRVKVQTKEAK